VWRTGEFPTRSSNPKGSRRRLGGPKPASLASTWSAEEIGGVSGASAGVGREGGGGGKGLVPRPSRKGQGTTGVLCGSWKRKVRNGSAWFSDETSTDSQVHPNENLIYVETRGP